MQAGLSQYSIHFERTGSTSKLIPLVLLHGALGTHHDLNRIRDCFSDRMIYSLDLPAHGDSTGSSSPLTSEKVGATLLEFLDTAELGRVDVIGYSLGGYAALEAAVIAPQRIRSIVSHAMKFYWSPEAIESATTPLDIEALRSNERYYASLQSMHMHGVQPLANAMTELMQSFAHRQLSVADITTAGTPLLLTAGDSDELVPLTELLSLFKEIGLNQSSMAVFPHTRHSLRTLPLQLFEHAVRHFWAALPG